jgi:PTS system ascorbate-specific IIA component
MKNRILIIAHGPLASALKNCLGHVLPEKMQDILALDVMPDATLQDSLRQAQNMLGSGSEESLLVLTDMLGATPCNVAQQLAKGRLARIVAGVNMPMLLRATSYQDEALELLVQRCLAGGTQGVLEVTRKEEVS